MNENFKITGKVTVSVKRLDGSEELICKDSSNLLTTAGRDWIHSQIYNSGTVDEAKYIALSSDTVAPTTADTVLTGEETTNGLQRTAGTYTHVVGTNTTTITYMFITTGSFTAIQKVGLFSAVSGGTLVHENNFTPVNLQAGDQLLINWTITAG